MVRYRYIDEVTYYHCRKPEVRILLEEYKVLKLTAKGCWIDYYGDQKFLLNGARKCFAYASLTEAWNSFMIRKRRQLDHRKRAFDSVQLVLAKATGSTADQPDRKDLFFLL